MDEILEILAKDARTTAEEIAQQTGQDVKAVKKKIRQYEKDGTIVKYKTVINRDLAGDEEAQVRALIEVTIDPQKDFGFDNIAERIYSFPEVTSCFLLSGTYDLLIVVEGRTIQTVADFISAKLSPMAHVRSTTSHFLLKKYKEDGQVLKQKAPPKRLNISY